MVELEVIGVRVEMPSNVPMLLLKDRESQRYLPLWIGATEATAIVNALEGLVPVRPMTHDLMATMLAELGHTRLEGRITAVVDGVFLGEVVIDGHVISARPSDVVALSLRAEFTVTCPQELMDEVGVEASAPADDMVERFKAFLDKVEPEDFES